MAVFGPLEFVVAVVALAKLWARVFVLVVGAAHHIEVGQPSFAVGGVGLTVVGVQPRMVSVAPAVEHLPRVSTSLM